MKLIISEMKYLQMYSLFLLVIFCTSAQAQNKTELTQDHLTSETKDAITSRVPAGMVRNIRQASNGNILIASYSSVFRYDGKSFTNLTSKISSPSFWDVLEDRRGNLWFATRDSGVYLSDGKSFQHFTTREGLADNRVTSIYEDKSGNIWFATGGGASRFDARSFRNFTTKDGLPDNDITTIIEDRTGKLWFGTRGEPCFYDGQKFTVLRNNDGKAFHNVWSMIEDKKGNIWFGAFLIDDQKRISDHGSVLFGEDGLWRYDGSGVIQVSKKGASAIIEDKNGNIWTTGSVDLDWKVWAFSRYDQKSLYSKKPKVKEIKSTKYMLCGILEANDGSIWFGSGNGVYRYDGKTVTNFKSEGISNNVSGQVCFR